MWFGVAFQDRREALSCARRRNKRATAARVRGAEGSATVLPALWAHIDFPGGVSADPRRGDRVATAVLFAEVPQPPSIVVSTLTGLDVYWLLDGPWVLAGEEDRRQAKLLLAKVRWALARTAPVERFKVDQTADLAGLARVPGPNPPQSPFFKGGRPLPSGSPLPPGSLSEPNPSGPRRERWRIDNKNRHPNGVLLMAHAV